ncbi:hypothetical protein [Porphyromonas endodontalis]|uniref:hypothetical protein n=1 Tax=Porphyromonas endodontalis TaxID=28124 RepID=UPI003C7C0095
MIETQTNKLLNDTPTTIVVGGATYQIAPPTFANLARISSEIAQLEMGTIDPAQLAEGVLREARHGYQLARIIATAIEETERPTRLQRLWRKLRERITRTTLTDRIYRTATPSEATQAFAEILQTLQLGDFFTFTTFLSGARITRATKVESETEATARGVSSQA